MNIQEALEYSTTQIVKQGKRAINDEDECVYFTEDGHRCAIGWLLDDKHEEFLFDVSDPLEYLPYSVLPVLVKKNMLFFREFQRFHDAASKEARRSIYESLMGGYDIKPHPIFEQWIELGA